jgi:hypothetical protein
MGRGMSSNLRKRECNAMAPRKKRPGEDKKNVPEKPKLASESMSADDWGKLPNTIMGWFDNALGTDDPKPSVEACIKLARDFQIILSRHNNAELERIAELEGRPASWAELKAKNFREFMDAANYLMAKADEFGGFVFTNGTTLADIQSILGGIGAYPKLRTPPSAKRGRSKEAWHSVVGDIARAIIRTMREAGYQGPLSAKNESSVTCGVGAEIINLAFGLCIKRATFVTAARNRDRTKQGAMSFFERFPDAARIRILD